MYVKDGTRVRSVLVEKAVEDETERIVDPCETARGRPLSGVGLPPWPCGVWRDGFDATRPFVAGCLAVDGCALVTFCFLDMTVPYGVGVGASRLRDAFDAG